VNPRVRIGLAIAAAVVGLWLVIDTLWVTDREAIAAQAAVSISGTSVRRSAPTSSSASITVGTAADLSAFSASPRPRSIPMRTLVIALQPPAALYLSD